MKFTISTVFVVSASAMLPFASASHPFAGLGRSSRRAASDSNKQRTLMEDPSTYGEDGCPLIECDKNHEDYEWGLDGEACHLNCGSDSDCQMPEGWGGDDDFPERDAQTWQGWCMKLPSRAQPTRRRLFGGMVESGCPRGKCYEDEFLPCAKHCGWYEDNHAELKDVFNDEREYLKDQTGYTCSLFSSFVSACGCDDPFSNWLASGMCDYNSGACLEPVGPVFCNNDISEDGATNCQDFVRGMWMEEDGGEGLAEPDKVWDLKVTIGCACPPENEDDDQPQTYCDNPECKQAYIDYYILYDEMTPESALQHSRCPPVS